MTTSPELERLVTLGQLDRLPGSARELQHLLTSGRRRLQDARNRELTPTSRFDLAYNAAHALASAALREAGYRAKNRYVVFQALEYTTGLKSAQWRVLALAHTKRNVMEYEGEGEIDIHLLDDLIRVATELEEIIVRST